MSTARDPRISPIFYYFSDHTDVKTGRTVGRKIGVVQEIIIKKFLNTSARIRDCLVYEPKLRGKSGATHKVEFVLFSPIFVATINEGQKLRYLNPSIQISIERTDSISNTAFVEISTAEYKQRKKMVSDNAVGFELIVDGVVTKVFLKLISIEGKNCRISLLNSNKPTASLESKRVGAQRFSGSDKLGSGIQTIEKAKQTSLVAIDFDLEFNEDLLLATPVGNFRNFKSFALLGNGVHWTDHDLSVLETYVDYTFQVKDESIIRYAEYVRAKSEHEGKSFFKYFMEYFAGMMVTPADDFEVTSADFLRLRPLRNNDNLNLVELVERQISEHSEILNLK